MLSQHTWYRRENVFTSNPDAEMTSFLSLNERDKSINFTAICANLPFGELKNKGMYKSVRGNSYSSRQLKGFSWSDERPAE